MAILQGVVQYTGKLGQTVGQRSATGKHAVRVYRDTIKNPKTDGQSVQRMILATVGVAVSYMTEILNNSFEGVQNGAQSLNHVRKLWLNMLREATASQSPSRYNYLPKGQKVFMPNPYQISSGRLIAPNMYFGDSGQVIEGLQVSLSATASEAFPMVAVGDQITFVAVGMIYDDTMQTEVGYCRFAFKDDTTPVFIQNSDGDTVLNPAAIDLSKAQGNWQGILWDSRNEYSGSVSLGAMLSENVEATGAVGVIISNIENKRRSTSYLILDPQMNLEMYAGGLVYPTYGNSGIEMDFPNEWYLNNSARRTGASGSSDAIILSSSLPASTRGGGITLQISGMPSNDISEYSDVILNVEGNDYNFGALEELEAPQAFPYDFSLSNVSLTNGWFFLEATTGANQNFTIRGGSFVYNGTKYQF